MFLRSGIRVLHHCPHRWSWATAIGLVALAIGAAGMAVCAEVQPPPREPQPARPPDAPPRPGLLPPEIEELIRSLENLPAGADAQQLRDRVMQALDQLRQAQIGALPPGAEDIRKRIEESLNRLRERRRGASPSSAGEGRLGVRIEAPTAALTDHLDVPPGEGQVILEVVPDSAAAKAGLKANDILLELNGKPVASDPRNFIRALDDIKPNTPVDALIMRRGKKEMIKGLTLPEAKAERPRRLLPGGGLLPPLPGRGLLPPLLGGPPAVLTTIVRTGDQFTTRSQEGGLTITLTGTVTDGKAKVETIQIQDGGNSDRYDGVDKVPEAHRDRVKRLVEMSERGTVTAESKSP
jgi:hypothetical protein